MKRLLVWLKDTHHKNHVKFIVSSVPFVAEVRSSTDEEQRNTDMRQHERSMDKWSGKSFKQQREEIIKFIHREKIQKVVFLVGDMHCCYHATMRIGPAHDQITVHELAGGPLYQLRLGRRENFFSHVEKTIRNLTRIGYEEGTGGRVPAVGCKVKGKNSNAVGVLLCAPIVTAGTWKDTDTEKGASGELMLLHESGEFRDEEVLQVANSLSAKVTKTIEKRLPYRAQLEQLHGGACGVLQISVIPNGARQQASAYEIHWQVIRTISAAVSADQSGDKHRIPAMSGCITL